VAPFDQVAQAETDKQEESGLSVLNPQEPVWGERFGLPWTKVKDDSAYTCANSQVP
jgi:hypothetical protein